MKYVVRYTITDFYTATVEAESAAEAQQKVEDNPIDQERELDSFETAVLEVEEVTA